MAIGASGTAGGAGGQDGGPAVGGDGGAGGSGSAALGGGILNAAGSLVLKKTFISSNQAIGGAGGAGGTGGLGIGSAGASGTNGRSGVGGDGGPGRSGGDAFGGGVFNAAGASLALTGASFFANRRSGEAADPEGSGTSGPAGPAGMITAELDLVGTVRAERGGRWRGRKWIGGWAANLGRVTLSGATSTFTSDVATGGTGGAGRSGDMALVEREATASERRRRPRAARPKVDRVVRAAAAATAQEARSSTVAAPHSSVTPCWSLRIPRLAISAVLAATEGSGTRARRNRRLERRCKRWGWRRGPGRQRRRRAASVARVKGAACSMTPVHLSC